MRAASPRGQSHFRATACERPKAEARRQEARGKQHDQASKLNSPIIFDAFFCACEWSD